MLDLYGGTTKLFQTVLPRFGIRTRFVPFHELNNIERYFSERTRLLVPGDAHQSHAALRRHPRALRHRAPAQCRGGGGQHVRHAHPAKAARTRRRPQPALRHQVPGRPQRPYRRRRRRPAPVAGSDPRNGEVHRRLPGSAGLVPVDSRPEDAGNPRRARLRQRSRHRRSPAPQPESGARVLSRVSPTIPATKSPAVRCATSA